MSTNTTVEVGDLIRYRGMAASTPSYRVVSVNSDNTVTFTWPYAFGMTETIQASAVIKVTKP